MTTRIYLKEIDLTKQPEFPTPLNTRLLIIGYEIGTMMKNFIYSNRTLRADEPEIKRAFIKNMRIELADLLTQIRILSQEQNFDLGELFKDGEERYYERMEEIRKKII